jgi:hypothetical protein
MSWHFGTSSGYPDSGSLPQWTDDKKAAWVRSLATQLELALWLAQPWIKEIRYKDGPRFLKHARQVWHGCPRELERIRFDIHALRDEFYGSKEQIPPSQLGLPFSQLPSYLRYRLPLWFEPFYTLIYLKYGNTERSKCKQEAGSGTLGMPDVKVKQESAHEQFTSHKRKSTTTRDGARKEHDSEEHVYHSIKRSKTENGITTSISQEFKRSIKPSHRLES